MMVDVRLNARAKAAIVELRSLSCPLIMHVIRRGVCHKPDMFKSRGLPVAGVVGVAESWWGSQKVRPQRQFSIPT